MKRVTTLLASMAAISLVFFALGCGDDKANPSSDGDVNDQDDTVDPGDDAVDPTEDIDNNVDGDTEGDVETGCSAVCDPNQGFFCNEATSNCAQITATGCNASSDCNTALGETCESYNGQNCKICLATCNASNTTCPVGYECLTAISKCVPLAVYQGCEKITSRNQHCTKTDRTCPTGTTCQFNDSLPSYPYGFCAKTCSTGNDCLNETGGVQETCVSNINLCMSRCTTVADCPENIDCLDPIGNGVSVCIHQSQFFSHGGASNGETCTRGTTNDCEEGNWCLSNKCRAMCNDAEDYFPDCEAGEFCQTLYSDIILGFCIPSGTAQPGKGCSLGSINTSLGDCAYPNDAEGKPVNSQCLALNVQNAETCTGTNTSTCTPENYYGEGGLFCYNGKCNSSFCSPFCDGDNSCAYLKTDYGYFGWQAVNVNMGSYVQCFCIPVSYGTSKVAEPCAFGDYNTTADACAEDLYCIGISTDPTAPNTQLACNELADCKAIDVDINAECNELFNGATSVGKYCGASYCAPMCDNSGTCDSVVSESHPEYAFEAQNIQGTCFCLPYIADACVDVTCSGHGSCKAADGSCICDTGFTGDACDACTDSGKTYPDCVEADPCAGIDCSGHGTCAGGTCTCATGFKGAACDSCADGYENYPTCSAVVDPCAGIDCSGHGTCAIGLCTCDTGYKGESCNDCDTGYTGYPTCVLE